MGKSAKIYKRSNKKEKLGLSSSSTPSRSSSSAANSKPPMARHAPISATIASMGGASTNKTAASARFVEDAAARSAVEQRAAKLLLEAEKRDAIRRGKEAVDSAGSDHEDRDEDMDEDTTTSGIMQQQPKAKKSTGGAAGLKQKIAKRRASGKGKDDHTTPKHDYVDLFEGKKPRR